MKSADSFLVVHVKLKTSPSLANAKSGSIVKAPDELSHAHDVAKCFAVSRIFKKIETKYACCIDIVIIVLRLKYVINQNLSEHL